MGEARRRGTREERIQQAEQRAIAREAEARRRSRESFERDTGHRVEDEQPEAQPCPKRINPALVALLAQAMAEEERRRWWK